MRFKLLSLPKNNPIPTDRKNDSERIDKNETIKPDPLKVIPQANRGPVEPECLEHGIQKSFSYPVIQMESVAQKEGRSEERKNETANIASGASSPVRTPVAEPIFIFKSGEIEASKLGLWHVEVVKGNREIAFPTDTRKRLRDGPFPIHLSVRKLSDNLYRLEADEMLDNGQYCLSPEGSQKVFCFEEY